MNRSLDVQSEGSRQRQKTSQTAQTKTGSTKRQQLLPESEAPIDLKRASSWLLTCFFYDTA